MLEPRVESIELVLAQRHCVLSGFWKNRALQLGRIQFGLKSRWRDHCGGNAGNHMRRFRRRLFLVRPKGKGPLPICLSATVVREPRKYSEVSPSASFVLGLQPGGLVFSRSGGKVREACRSRVRRLGPSPSLSQKRGKGRRNRFQRLPPSPNLSHQGRGNNVSAVPIVLLGPQPDGPP
jgi:hypothetical protein